MKITNIVQIQPDDLKFYFLAKSTLIVVEALIAKPLSTSTTAAASSVVSNSTNAISVFPGTDRTSLKPW